MEKVVNSFDGTVCVRRSYREDKNELYRLLAELKSPFFPEIVEIFENDGQTEIIERYIEGKTLAKLIADAEINKTLAKKIARQLLCAVADIQKANIIHRDIKPENIIISGDKLTLIDFGIARIFKENETRDTRHLGTEGYAAPEQYGFSQSDKRTDIFSVGKTILRVCEATGVKGAVKRIAERCAQFDPGQRFATAEDALRSFDRRQKLPVYAMLASVVLFTVLGVSLSSIYWNKRLQVTQEQDVAAHKIQSEKDTQADSAKTEKVEKTDAEETNQKDHGTKEQPKVRTETPPIAQQSKKTEIKKEETVQETQTVETEQPRAAQPHSREETEVKQANYREHDGIIRSSGKILELFYPGDGAGFEDSVNFRGKKTKISAQLKRKKLQMKIGNQQLDIIYGEFVSNYESDTTILEADINLRDIDGDGIEELFVGVRLRHGFATASSTLWFARYSGGKFVLCDKPIYFGDYIKFNIYGNNRIITSFWGDSFHIEGYKFIKD